MYTIFEKNNSDSVLVVTNKQWSHEVSDEMAAMFVLDNDSYYTSHQFVNLHPWDVVRMSPTVFS